MRVRRWMPLVLVLPLAVAVAQDGPRPDPLPLRRVQIGPERVALELERAQKGALVLLPRQEFEAKVQQAALAQEQGANPPRILKASYFRNSWSMKCGRWWKTDTGRRIPWDSQARLMGLLLRFTP